MTVFPVKALRSSGIGIGIPIEFPRFLTIHLTMGVRNTARSKLRDQGDNAIEQHSLQRFGPEPELHTLPISMSFNEGIPTSLPCM